jgi:hypothetical protein
MSETALATLLATRPLPEAISALHQELLMPLVVMRSASS